MYIKSIEIRAIRSIKQLSWQLEESQLAGWHVFLGANGSGKSTELRSIALALIGQLNAFALRQPWESWLTNGQSKGQIVLRLMIDNTFDQMNANGSQAGRIIKTNLTISRGNQGTVMLSGDAVEQSLRAGQFSAAYGPFRRFTGGELRG